MCIAIIIVKVSCLALSMSKQCVLEWRFVEHFMTKRSNVFFKKSHWLKSVERAEIGKKRWLDGCPIVVEMYVCNRDACDKLQRMLESLEWPPVLLSCMLLWSGQPLTVVADLRAPIVLLYLANIARNTRSFASYMYTLSCFKQLLLLVHTPPNWSGKIGDSLTCWLDGRRLINRST